MSANMGRLFAPWQGSSNKIADDLCYWGQKWQKYNRKYQDFVELLDIEQYPVKLDGRFHKMQAWNFRVFKDK